MTLGEYIGAGSATTKLLLHLNGNSTDSSGNGNNGTDTDVLYHKGIRWVDDFSSGNYDNWTVTSGTWNIVSGKLRSTVAGKISRPISSGDNIFVQAKITVGADGNDVRRLMLYDESNNYISVWMRWDTNRVQLLKTGDESAGGNSYTLSSGTEYTVRLYKYGSTYSLYINGALIRTAANFYNFTPTKVTLFSESDATTDYDDIVFSTIAEGKFNEGAGFNGSTSKIVFGDVLDFEYNEAFSISIWFKTSSAGYGALVSKQSDTTGNGYAIYVNPSSKIEVQLNGEDSATVFGNTNVADGNWHNVIVVKTTSTNIADVKIYLDGKNDTASSSGTLAATISNAITFAIGCRDSVNLFFNGNIDEVIIENRAWSAEEIKKRYTFALGRF